MWRRKGGGVPLGIETILREGIGSMNWLVARAAASRWGLKLRKSPLKAAFVPRRKGGGVPLGIETFKSSELALNAMVSQGRRRPVGD